MISLHNGLQEAVRSTSSDRSDYFAFKKAGQSLPAGLVSRLRFQGSLADDTGRPWTIRGAASIGTTTPLYGTGYLNLPSEGSGIQTAAGLEAFVPRAGDFTIEVWAQGLSEPATLYDGNNGLLMCASSANQMFFYNDTTGNWPFYTFNGMNFFDGAPYYFCLQRKDGLLVAWANTARALGNTNSSMETFDFVNVPALVTLGDRQAGSSYRPFKGRMNGFRFWSKALYDPTQNLASVPSPLS